MSKDIDVLLVCDSDQKGVFFVHFIDGGKKKVTNG